MTIRPAFMPRSPQEKSRPHDEELELEQEKEKEKEEEEAVQLRKTTSSSHGHSSGHSRSSRSGVREGGPGSGSESSESSSGKEDSRLQRYLISYLLAPSSYTLFARNLAGSSRHLVPTLLYCTMLCCTVLYNANQLIGMV